MTLLLHRLPDSVYDLEVTLGDPAKGGLCSDRLPACLPLLPAGENGALACERPDPLWSIP